MLQHLPVLQIVLPLLSAPFCVLIRDRRAALAWTIGVCWMTFLMSCWLLSQVMESGAISYQLGGWVAPWGIEYHIDIVSAFVMFFVSAMGAFVITYAPSSLNAEIPKDKHYLFCVMYLLCLTGLMGICITGDLFNMFVFLEISSLSSYALIALGKSRKALMAAFQYLVMGTIGATFLLLGIGLLYQMTGTLNMHDIAERLGESAGLRTVKVAIAFMLVGVSIKMALFPLHSWLPSAYTYAPSVVSAFVAATATKVSVYMMLRIFFSIFRPSIALQDLPLARGLMVLALIGIFLASTAAIFQTNIKRMLAYSSVAQIGYIILGISFVSLTGVTGGIVHLFNHALIKGGLFMAMGCFALRLGSVDLKDLKGVGRRMPWTMFAWVIGGLGLIGVPVTAGFISKWLLLTAAFESGFWYVAILVLISSLLSLIYVWRVVEVAYFLEPDSDAELVREAPLSMLIPTYVVIGATIVFGIWTAMSVGVARQAAASLLGVTL